MEIRRKVQVHLWRVDGAGRRVYASLHRCAAKGDYHQPITGNVDAGENLDAAALREACEEVGIRAAPADLSPALWVQDWSHPERPGILFSESVYALRCPAAELTLSGEHRGHRWLPYGEALASFAFEGNRRGLAFVEAWLGRADDAGHPEI